MHDKERQRFADTYYNDPVAFVRDCFAWRKEGDGATAYQQDVLASVPIKRRVSVRGPHGLGKTSTAAWVILWFALTREAKGVDWKIPCTASAWRQLTKFLWPEVHKWAKRLYWDRIRWRGVFNERTELLQLSLKLSYGEAFAVASDQAELIEGAHADSLLYLFDESKAIPVKTFDAAEGAFSGSGADTAQEAFALAISTPGEPNGRFYDIQSRKAGYEDWHVRFVTLEETIASGRVSREWAHQRALQWGETSAVYLNRVKGEFASSDEDGVIPLSYIESAVERWHAWHDAGGAQGQSITHLGVDVGLTGDKTIFAPRYGDACDTLRYLPREDPAIALMATAGRIKGILDANKGCVAVVDVNGIGAGVVHRLREQKANVTAFGAAERALDHSGKPLLDQSGELGFANMRAAAWWKLRELLDPANKGEIALPPDDLLIGDLTAPKYKVLSGSKILVESKDDVRKRIGRSTDCADAVIQAYFALPSRKSWDYDIY